MTDWDIALHASVTAALGPAGELIVRLAAAALAGGLVGLEREVRGRQAGFRTCLLVCLGACLVMIVSIGLSQHPWAPAPGGDYAIQVDPGRIAYGVMTGVGFLGAGTIIQNRSGVRGLTTAAGVWGLAAVGLGLGAGQYVVALAATAMIVVALWLLNYVEAALPRAHYRLMTFRAVYRPGCVGEAVRQIEAAGMQVKSVSFDRDDDLRHAEIKLRVSYLKTHQFDRLEQTLQDGETFHLVGVRES